MLLFRLFYFYFILFCPEAVCADVFRPILGVLGLTLCVRGREDKYPVDTHSPFLELIWANTL